MAHHLIPSKATIKSIKAGDARHRLTAGAGLYLRLFVKGGSHGWRFDWRPNLPDEADNHLIELGVAAQAEAIVTRNLRDVARGELKFPSLRVLTPEQCLEVFPCPP
jgi:hypothetical protein